MKVLIHKPSIRSKAGYNHICLFAVSWGRDGVLVTLINIPIIVKWGKSIKPYQTK